MEQPFYDLTVPVFITHLATLKRLLEKGRAHAASVGMSEADLLIEALAPDMFPLRKQVQIATDNAKGAVARLAGVEPLSIADDEETIEALLARLDTVMAYVESFTPAQLADAAVREVRLPYFPGVHFKGHDYLTEFVLPNFYFHLSMVYAILRKVGTPIGKMDYLGTLSLAPDA